MPPPARALVVGGFSRRSEGPLLVVVPSEREAESLASDVRLFHDDVLHFPSWETLPFEHVSPNMATMARRAEARHRMAKSPAGLVVVASVRAVIQRVSTSSVEPVVLEVGREVPFEKLVTRLDGAGYSRTDRVESRGEFAVRGGIVDLFPAQSDDPVRVEFWGDGIDEIRVFAVGTQRSMGEVNAVTAYPAREFRPDSTVRAAARALQASEPWAYSTWDRIAAGVRFAGIESWLPWLADPLSFLDDLPDSGTLVLLDPVRARSMAEDLAREEQDLAEALAETWGDRYSDGGHRPSLFLDLAAGLQDRLIECPPLPTRPEDRRIEVGTLSAAPGDPEAVVAGLSHLMARRFDVILAMDGAPAAARVARVLGEHGLQLPVIERLDGEAGNGVLADAVDMGVVLPALRVAVLGEREIVGRRMAHRHPGRRRPAPGPSYQDLTPGDYVVHSHHGIGRFDGLVSRTIAGVERDYLVIAYAKGDKLYVPTDQLAAVRKYTGGESPRVSRMGGSDWATTRNRVRREAAVLADHVVAVHRARAMAVGHAFAPDTPWQQEVEEAFPYEETSDQLRTIEEVKQDMEEASPMDRLVFGDVGFGKTEVACERLSKRSWTGSRLRCCARPRSWYSNTSRPSPNGSSPIPSGSRSSAVS